MSHFVVFALVNPEDFADRPLKEAIADLLAPYDENKRVAPYKRDCYCINDKAEADSYKQAEKQLGYNRGSRWDVFHGLPEVLEIRAAMATIRQSDADGEELKKNEDRLAEYDLRLEQIREEVFAEYDNLRKSLVEAHPEFNKPDPSCDECQGTGKHTSRSNPDGKWDWWVIGGRWTGYLSDYNPDKDPANYETCIHCNGIGHRWIEFSAREAVHKLLNREGKTPFVLDERESWETFVHNAMLEAKEKDCLAQISEALYRNDYPCGCEDGKRLKFPTQWPDKGNYAPVSVAIPFIQETKHYPYALVTPDGQWIGKGEMGWFGMSSGDEKESDWRVRVLAIMADHPDAMAVVVDCHV